MKILVANLGSTSFKYRLFDMETEQQLARGGIDRIGEDAESNCVVEIGSHAAKETKHIPDHAAAVQMCLDQLMHSDTGCLNSVDEVAAIGFKAVFAGKLSGIKIVNEELLQAMENLADVAPAHNPPYVRAMRQLQASFPKIPLVAALETAFHETIPEKYRTYSVPYQWTQQYEVLRWGFHGASHRFIGTRMAELLGKEDAKVISCHLGGSSSICAMLGGLSQSTSMGMTPQSGLPQNNRVGDFDPFALRLVKRLSGKDYDELLDELSTQGGLLGLSGVSNDCRDIEIAAANGNEQAQLAVDVYAADIKKYIGQYLAVLNGADALVFTGGIGENSDTIRSKVCEDMTFAGIELDSDKNSSTREEGKISADNSKLQIWIVPTNEELVVARQTAKLVQN
ncbi:acetate/propionate family kinase [Thalassoglobus polymorphus]|uniref:Acetate kinase n=1 Tax=Thalassoglobus polymorphus TaxID=2527994 RepID=A0A517QH87_9PLAN|nr:acetate/propionate family kinase [Thalassoglobus polymorphus]QDT30999.1 Acetate kinase [Thalassoglobus polymorphus]